MNDSNSSSSARKAFGNVLPQRGLFRALRSGSHRYGSLRYGRVSIGLSTLAAILIIAGCAANRDDSNDDSGDGSTDAGTHDTFSATTDDNGVATATFSVPDGTTKFQLIADAQGADLRLERLSDDRDVDYLSPGGKELTLSQDFATLVAVADAPSRNLDPNLDTSQKFRVDVQLGSGDSVDDTADVPVSFKVVSKQDPDLTSGVLHVNIYYVGSVGQDPDNKNAIHAATGIFQDIYQTNAKITLSITERDIDGPSTLPDPFTGDDFYQTASAMGGNTPAVNIFITGDIDGLEGEAFGVSGDIPGPVLPSARSGVTVSMVTSAGADGAFSAEELRILGETMAHEAGHFLGLFHPIDFTDITQADSSVSASDPLTDTPTCSTQSECSTVNALAQNLMYPTPVSDGNGGFLPQNQLTAQQSAVLNRSLAVD